MTPDPLPLAAAQRRLGRPGRPRRHPENGHVSGHDERDAAQPREMTRANGPATGAGVSPTADTPPAVVLEPLAVVSVPPALLSLDDAGRYLGGLSARTVAEYVASGLLAPVPLPGRRGRRSRRVVLAREDLDRLVASWKRRS